MDGLILVITWVRNLISSQFSKQVWSLEEKVDIKDDVNEPRKDQQYDVKEPRVVP